MPDDRLLEQGSNVWYLQWLNNERTRRTSSRLQINDDNDKRRDKLVLVMFFSDEGDDDDDYGFEI
jgi:hypothetical protein